ncbi:hypothetical protein TNCV_575311 [Trichonephila clavipes]|nr:hypothetical protein TNCV_575311 [Trichonephila clavipes]
MLLEITEEIHNITSYDVNEIFEKLLEVTSSRLSATEDPPSRRTDTVKPVVAQSLPVGMVWMFGKGVPDRCPTRHLSKVQDCEDHRQKPSCSFAV